MAKQSSKLLPARLLCPRNSLGKNTGVGCRSLLRGPRDWTWLSCTAGRFFTVFLGQTQFLGSCTWIVDVWVKRNFLSFFFTRTILKVLIELATVLLLFYLLFFFFFSWSVMVNFVCYLDWANGWSENWWNSTSCCVFEAVSRGQKHLKWQTE